MGVPGLMSQPNPTMTTEITVDRDGTDLEGTAALFFDAVKYEQSAPGEDYPYAFVVEMNGDTFIGFDTDLPESREPWTVGDMKFERDTVFEVGPMGNLDYAAGVDGSIVNGLLDVVADDEK